MSNKPAENGSTALNGLEPVYSHRFDDPDDYQDDGAWEDDEYEVAMDLCGLDDEGQCSMAGTEHCDFKCPFRDSEDFCGSAAWYRKRGETPPWEKSPPLSSEHEGEGV